MSSPNGEQPEDVADDRQQEPADAQAAEQGDGGEKDDDGKVSRGALEKVQREAKNLRAKLKELEPMARRLQEIEDSQKSETQKLSDELAAREVELQELRVERVRIKAGQDAKLDPELWEFITASDPEEAAAQAKRLAARVAAPEPGAADLRQGARRPAKAAPNPNDLLRSMAGYQ